MSYLYGGKSFLDEVDMRSAGFSRIAGVDEVGRGSGFSQVTVACVMLHIDHGIKGLRDSKALSEKRREEFYDKIQEKALSISIAEASNKEIDRINILQATLKCMHKAVENMSIVPEFVFVDGVYTLHSLYVPYASIPGGDGAQIYEIKGSKKELVGHHYENIAAASIIAKVHRDRSMKVYDKMYPEYGLCRNKGYLTKEHRDAIKKYGITPLHRKSFNGVG